MQNSDIDVLTIGWKLYKKNISLTLIIHNNNL